MATEEPKHRVLEKRDGFEIRLYEPQVVAETLVEGEFGDGGNEGFRRVAGYIFGGNQGARKLAMTAPVTQAPQKLAMTAPVTQTAAGDSFVVQFVLPKGVTVENAPVPNDARIRLRTVPERRLAAVRFSGFWSDANYAEHLAKLTAAMRVAGLQATGEPVLSRYNPPITPWFLRRNEIWIDVA